MIKVKIPLSPPLQKGDFKTLNLESDSHESPPLIKGGWGDLTRGTKNAS